MILFKTPCINSVIVNFVCGVKTANVINGKTADWRPYTNVRPRVIDSIYLIETSERNSVDVENSSSLGRFSKTSTLLVLIFYLATILVFQ